MKPELRDIGRYAAAGLTAYLIGFGTAHQGNETRDPASYGYSYTGVKFDREDLTPSPRIVFENPSSPEEEHQIPESVTTPNANDQSGEVVSALTKKEEPIGSQPQVLEKGTPVRVSGEGRSPTSGQALVTGYYCEYDSGVRGDGGGYCGAMSNGEVVYEGAVACGSNWQLGTTLYIENLDRFVTCKDRGYLASNQIDVFSQHSSGLVKTQTSNVEIVSQ